MIGRRKSPTYSRRYDGSAGKKLQPEKISCPQTILIETLKNWL
jgi:hypothetical protein